MEARRARRGARAGSAATTDRGVLYVRRERKERAPRSQPPDRSPQPMNYSDTLPGNFARKEGDAVGVFLVGNGVELDRIEDSRFDARGQARALLGAGGRILACGTCLTLKRIPG